MRAAVWMLLALSAPAAARAEWPREPSRTAPPDPARPFRWASLPAWVAPTPVRAREALAALDREPAHTAAWAQRRAILLRLLARADEAEASLAEARRLLGGGLDDPDAMLTAAWLDARRSQFGRATAMAMAALPLLPARSEALALTVVRWSLARGPEGTRDAWAVLSALRVSEGWSPRAASLAALVLAREGDEAGARAVARTVTASLSPALAEPHPADRQDPAFMEQVNAVGVALLLDGRPSEAAPLLRRATDQTPPGWRAFQQRALLRAGR